MGELHQCSAHPPIELPIGFGHPGKLARDQSIMLFKFPIILSSNSF